MGVRGSLHGPRSATPTAAPDTPRRDELEAANASFLRGEYASARAAYRRLAASGRISFTEYARSAALCSLKLGELGAASDELAWLTASSADDWRLIAEVKAQLGSVREAAKAFDHIPPEDSATDTELCEQLAMSSARAGDKADAWRFYRLVEEVDPGGASMQRLTDSGQFAFTRNFFGYDQHSLLNYARGAKDGVIDWGTDALKGLWHLVRHPVDSVESFAGGVAQIFSKENLGLLLSPTVMASKLGTVAARVYWAAWESCKNSAAREYALDVNDFGAQQKIHEIAAGRMVGYVAPDLILLVLSVGGGAAAKAADVEKAVEGAAEGIEKANQIARSAAFLDDARKWPALLKISWLQDETWQLIKRSSRIETRCGFGKVAGWMSDIKNVPGAEALVRCMATRLRLGDDGYLFQLERAAEYARKNQGARIGRRFHVDVALPGKAVQPMLAEADLELKDGTLVETKFRTSSLAWNEELHLQLQKYNRAVAEGQFKRDRCSVFPSPVEIVENVKTDLN